MKEFFDEIRSLADLRSIDADFDYNALTIKIYQEQTGFFNLIKNRVKVCEVYFHEGTANIVLIKRLSSQYDISIVEKLISNVLDMHFVNFEYSLIDALD